MTTSPKNESRSASPAPGTEPSLDFHVCMQRAKDSAKIFYDLEDRSSADMTKERFTAACNLKEAMKGLLIRSGGISEFGVADGLFLAKAAEFWPSLCGYVSHVRHAADGGIEQEPYGGHFIAELSALVILGKIK
jgi:hypothetical protein